MKDNQKAKFRSNHGHAPCRYGFVARGARASLFTRVEHVSNIQSHVIACTDKCIVAHLQENISIEK